MRSTSLALSLVAVFAFPLVLRADTEADFDFPGTPFTLEQRGNSPGAAASTVDGPTGPYMVLTEAANGLNNFVSFDNSDAGPADSSTFSFDFIIAPDQTPSADGISFSYVSTASYGSTGAFGGTFTPEDPAAAGVLGFGFDTWSNQGAHDNPDVPTGSDYSEISLFWDGSVVARIDDTRLDPFNPLTLDDSEWHNVSGTVDFVNGLVSMEVDGNLVLDDITVPGLAPFESRIIFAARTGGENELAGIDNVSVQFGGPVVPEPSTIVLAIFGLLALFVFRRKK